MLKVTWLKHRVPSSVEGCVRGGGHVTEAHRESLWTMKVTEPASIVRLHCVTWE